MLNITIDFITKQFVKKRSVLLCGRALINKQATPSTEGIQIQSTSKNRTNPVFRCSICVQLLNGPIDIGMAFETWTNWSSFASLDHFISKNIFFV